MITLRESVSRETLDRLDAYVDLIKVWSPRINLISPGTVERIWDRHIVDSAQLSMLAPEDVRLWGDLGSGGGFPGIVIAILRPQSQITLIESDQRKATFLRTCLRQLDIEGTVLTDRIEQSDALGANVISARALAPLPKLLGYVARHIAPGGLAILPKGQSSEQEVAEARKTWSFDVAAHPSMTDPAARVLMIERIKRV